MAGGPFGSTLPVRAVLDPDQTPDSLQLKWGISDDLACRVMRMAYRFRELTGHELIVISGFRSCEEQNELAERGRPAAPCDVSNHVRCPATAVDLIIAGSVRATRELRLNFGAAAIEAGLRWGGGSPIDDDGIPSDWNHVDLGPRNT